MLRKKSEGSKITYCMKRTHKRQGIISPSRKSGSPAASVNPVEANCLLFG